MAFLSSRKCVRPPDSVSSRSQLEYLELLALRLVPHLYRNSIGVSEDMIEEIVQIGPPHGPGCGNVNSDRIPVAGKQVVTTLSNKLPREITIAF